MPLVKKVNPDWLPSENKGLQVGEVIEMTNTEELVRQGMAVYVDAQGNELQRTGVEMLSCPTCTFRTDDQYKLAYHILAIHPRPAPKADLDGSVLTPAAPAVEPEKTEVSVEEKTQDLGKLEDASETKPQKAFKDMTDEEKKAWRIENLRRGREAKKNA